MFEEYTQRNAEMRLGDTRKRNSSTLTMMVFGDHGYAFNWECRCFNVERVAPTHRGLCSWIIVFYERNMQINVLNNCARGTF